MRTRVGWQNLLAILLCSLLVLSTVSPAVFNLWNDDDPEAPVGILIGSPARETVGAIYEGVELKQSLSGITGIYKEVRLLVATYARKNNGFMTVSATVTKNKRAESVSNKEFKLGDLPDNSFLSIEFSKSIDLEDAELEIRINVKADEKNAITFWIGATSAEQGFQLSLNNRKIENRMIVSLLMPEGIK